MGSDNEKKLAESIDKLYNQLRGNSGGNSSSASPTRFSGSGGGFTSGIPGIDSITSAADKMTQGVRSAVSNWEESSAQLGISFNNDAIGLRTSIATTRMSIEEWGASIDRGKLGFTALGGSMSESAKKFNQLSYEFSNTAAADQLREMGIKTGEYNQILALTLAGNKRLNREGGQTSAEALAATAKLAKEMDKVAQLTGISRKEQEDALQEQQKNARLQIAVEDAIAAGGKDAADAYKLMSTQLQGLGLDKFAAELYTGQQLTAEATSTLNALGPAGTQLQAAVAAVRDAKTAEQRTAATAALENAKLAVAQQESTASFRATARRGEGDVAEAAQKLWIAGKNYRDGLEKQTQTSGSIIEAQKDISKTVDYSQEGKTATGEQSAGALTTKAVIDVESRIKDTNVIVARIEQAGNERMGKYLADSKILGELVNIKPSTGEGNVPKGTMISSAERAGLLPESFTKIPKSIENASVIEDIPGILKGAMSDIGKAGLNVASQSVRLVSETVGIDSSKLGKQEQNLELPGRATGSKDATGSWVENFGTGKNMTLHGNEIVLPESKISEFITDMQTKLGGNQKTNAFSQMEQAFKSNLEKLESTNITKQIGNENIAPSTNTPADIQPVSTGTVSLKDLNDQLTKLNTVMVKLVSNTNEMVNNSNKQYIATKQLSPNLHER